MLSKLAIVAACVLLAAAGHEAKAENAVEKRVNDAVKTEPTVVGVILKAGPGISLKAIKDRDIWGGGNSFFRKPFG